MRRKWIKNYYWGSENLFIDLIIKLTLFKRCGEAIKEHANSELAFHLLQSHKQVEETNLSSIPYQSDW